MRELPIDELPGTATYDWWPYVELRDVVLLRDPMGRSQYGIVTSIEQDHIDATVIGDTQRVYLAGVQRVTVTSVVDI